MIHAVSKKPKNLLHFQNREFVLALDPLVVPTVRITSRYWREATDTHTLVASGVTFTRAPAHVHACVDTTYDQLKRLKALLRVRVFWS